MQKFCTHIHTHIILCYIYIIPGGNTVIIMTREFDPVTEMPLHPSEFGEGNLKSDIELNCLPFLCLLHS